MDNLEQVLQNYYAYLHQKYKGARFENRINDVVQLYEAFSARHSANLHCFYDSLNSGGISYNIILHNLIKHHNRFCMKIYLTQTLLHIQSV